MPSDLPERYRFDAYEFVTSTGYLYRKGHPLRLSEQQGRLLQALLEHAGEVVTPQEIRFLLWPNGEHLDHNHAIRNAINQLRAIFRDKPQQPRFIETLPKRGYRFVASVTAQAAVVRPIEDVVLPAPTLLPEAEIILVENVLSPTNLLAASKPPAFAVRDSSGTEPVIAEVAPITRRRRRWVFAAVIFLLATAVVTGLYIHHSKSNIHGAPAIITLGIAPIDASGTAAQQLAEPFRLELMDSVSQLPGVEVRATHSFPNDPASMNNLHGLAQKLQLDALFLGRIEAVDASHFNFIFELVRGSDAVHLASFHYSGTANQLGATRDHIQRDLFYRISSVSNRRLRPVRSTENSAAYSEYLSGRAELIRHDDAAIQQAIIHFRKAVDLDSGFAQAHAGLGSAYLLMGEHAASNRETLYAQARAFALKAISLNPDLGEAHATLGFLDFRHDWNPTASEAEFRRAIELDPNQAMHRIMFALLLCNTGRGPEALEQIARAHDADPFWPPIYITEMYVASAGHKNDVALDSARKLLDFMPNWPLAHDQSAWAYWYAGRYEEAVQEWMRMAQIEQDQRRLVFEREGLRILHLRGVAAYARYKLQAIQHAGADSWNHPNDFQLAEWQINAGQDAEAIVSMEHMVHEHDPEALQFAASPAYQRLHDNPGFRALLTRIGLPHP